MNQHCHSCGMPVQGEEGKDYRGNYCLYCSDENGNLYPREVVQKGIADWLKSITPNVEADYLQRAGNYLNAMPAWAKEVL